MVPQGRAPKAVPQSRFHSSIDTQHPRPRHSQCRYLGDGTVWGGAGGGRGGGGLGPVGSFVLPRSITRSSFPLFYRPFSPFPFSLHWSQSSLSLSLSLSLSPSLPPSSPLSIYLSPVRACHRPRPRAVQREASCACRASRAGYAHPHAEHPVLRSRIPRAVLFSRSAGQSAAESGTRHQSVSTDTGW